MEYVMAYELKGKKVLIITSNTGVEKPELLEPLVQLRGWGAKVTHAAIKQEPVQTFINDTKPDEQIPCDGFIGEMSEKDFDVLVIPGGTVNGDKIRVDPTAQACVKAFVAAGKPIAAVCHGPWLFVNAEVIKGKTLTSYFSVKLDLLNAGAAQWLDQAVVHCTANGWTLITSRNPNDLSQFSEAIAQELVGKPA